MPPVHIRHICQSAGNNTLQSIQIYAFWRAQSKAVWVHPMLSKMNIKWKCSRVNVCYGIHDNFNEVTTIHNFYDDGFVGHLFVQ